MKRLVIALSAFALLGCSHPQPTATQPTTPVPVEESPVKKPPAHVGDTLDLMRIGEQKIAVTLTQVVNPATVPNGWGDPAKNYIATKLTITNTGVTTIVGNSNSNVTVVGSDNKAYQADFATVVECTDFVYGWFLIPVGAAKSGCVVFALPSAVTPVKIRYTPSSGISKDVGEWLYP